ncbi:MAG: hypothetical protein R3B13_36105 [Polyangiaceae bacterium]
MRRLLSIFALLGLGACVSALGVDEERESAVESFCRCLPDSAPVSYEDCVATLNGRLDSASSNTRANWLRNFANNNCGVDCTQQLLAKNCLGLEPTCGQIGDKCTVQVLPCCGSLTCKPIGQNAFACQP